MKKLVLLLLVNGSVYAQQRFENFSSLRAQRGTYASWALVRYGTSMGDAMGGVFFWDSTSVATDDGKRTIGAWTKGRYMKSETLTMKRGVNQFTTTLLGSQTFVFAHGLSSTPVNVLYNFQLSSPAQFGTSWSADATNITITINTLVSLGTIKINWAAYPD
ncbi:hypothetical protein GCM10028807_32510 [Spirosoma daeguense]